MKKKKKKNHYATLCGLHTERVKFSASREEVSTTVQVPVNVIYDLLTLLGFPVPLHQ